MITAEEKLLRMVYIDDLKSGAVTQETPICPGCLEVINVLADNVPVEYQKITVGGKDYCLMIPTCPHCGTHVRAKYHLVH